jgi:MscS family membrane protein
MVRNSLGLLNRYRRAFGILIVTMVILSAGAVSSLGSVAPSFTGKWNTSYGTMTLRVDQDVVTGQYDNGGTIGDINGNVQGNVLKGTWTDKSGNGYVKFTLSSDGHSFKGNWGRSKGDGNAGGEWNGWR